MIGRNRYALGLKFALVFLLAFPIAISYASPSPTGNEVSPDTHAVLLGDFGDADYLRANGRGRGPDGQGPPGLRDRNGNGDPTPVPTPEQTPEPMPDPTPEPTPEATPEPEDEDDPRDNEDAPPSTRIQQMVDEASAGDTIEVPEGIYRETIVINKPITLVAEPGAEIRGSDVWTDWSQSGEQWVSIDSVPEFREISSGRCHSWGAGLCAMPEQVFIDGEPLQQVTGDPQPGQFAVNDNRNVVLADDPSSRQVEVTVREVWVSAPSGGGNADNVTIDGFTMKHSASTFKRGAIRNMEGDNWTITNNDLSYAHGAAIWLIHTSDATITYNEIHHNGQQGIALYRVDGGVINHNSIHNNNTQWFRASHEAGGIKGTVSQGLVFEYNEIHNNHGPGLWADHQSEGWIIRHNRIHNNALAGITYEVSYNGRIHDNVIWENGHWASNPPVGAGINLQIAQGTKVYNNVVAWNGDGITIWDRERTDGWEVRVAGNHVYDNDIFIVAHRDWDEFGLAWLPFRYGGSALYDSNSDNRGWDNRYFHANPQSERPRPFRWLDSEFAWGEIDEFSATPGENNPTLLTSAEKNEILNSQGVPTEPER